jgi:hypothetical protein
VVAYAAGSLADEDLLQPASHGALYRVVQVPMFSISLDKCFAAVRMACYHLLLAHAASVMSFPVH